MTSISFDLHGKFSRQLKAYMAGIGYNETRDYVEGPYSTKAAADGKHTLVFSETKAAENAERRWTALAAKGFKEAN